MSDVVGLNKSFFAAEVWANPYTKEPISFDGVWLDGQPNGARYFQNIIH